MSARCRVLALAFCALCLPATAAAQQARALLTRDTVYVGDILGVVLEVIAPAGSQLTVPDSLEVSGDIENAARRRVRVDTLDQGGLRYLITYPLALWRPGDYEPFRLKATLQIGADSEPIEAISPPLTVASVLPADTTNIQPKPLRDVWGANRVWWPLVLLALLLIGIIGALIWWWRKRRKDVPEEVVPIAPPVTPREWVQQEIDRIVAAHYIERADFRGFYIDLTGVMRTYMSRLDAGWSSDLTTSELAGRVGGLGSAAAPLFTVLQRADLVKFARHRPISSEAHGDIAALREWVNTFEKPLPLAEAA
jgi:hypothetical protein